MLIVTQACRKDTYKEALGNITHSRVEVDPPKEEAVAERSLPSPFKMVPTLKPRGADDS